ncbi:WRKY transcription factor 33 [Vigna unguiculata]|uniref:WRKY transcription factor 33 n=1 Tax=Vigna unguiculata TaxID=3917 RepID=A0A4D6L8F9_VIGUN|nr:WRKY transcription factor 33 [Vigna unguiculata]
MDFFYFENPHPSNSHDHHLHNNMPPSSPEIALSDFLLLDDFLHHHHHHGDSPPSSQSTESSEKPTFSDTTHGFTTGATSKNNNNNMQNANSGSKARLGPRIAFRTQSELEIMDDGYKWRKYGKKSVKSSPNLRNYYKCSSGGCSVKKRVERDREDSSYVITTYEGVHNHQSPFTTYYSPISFLHSDDSTSSK